MQFANKELILSWERQRTTPRRSRGVFLQGMIVKKPVTFSFSAGAGGGGAANLLNILEVNIRKREDLSANSTLCKMKQFCNAHKEVKKQPSDTESMNWRNME